MAGRRLIVPVWVPGMTADRDVQAPDVEGIFRACVAYRQRTPGTMPGKTELLCRLVLVAENERDCWRKRAESAECALGDGLPDLPEDRYGHATGRVPQ